MNLCLGEDTQTHQKENKHMFCCFFQQSCFRVSEISFHVLGTLVGRSFSVVLPCTPESFTCAGVAGLSFCFCTNLDEGVSSWFMKNANNFDGCTYRICSVIFLGMCTIYLILTYPDYVAQDCC